MSSVAGTWVPESEYAASPRAITLAAIKLGIRERGDQHTPEDGERTLKRLSDENITHGWSKSHPIKSCEPPVQKRRPFAKDSLRESMEGEWFLEHLEGDGPTIWKHDPGVGKTTSAGKGVANSGVKHAFLFDKHSKAREYILQKETPDDYLHLKGPDQPLNECCLDTQIESDRTRCLKHGTEEDWPRMCPLYELDKDDPRWQRYKTHVAIYGKREAHSEFCDGCNWSAQFFELEDLERVVGVHEHQRLLNNMGFEIIIDESPRILGDVEKVYAEDIRRAGRAITTLDSKHAQILGEFVRDSLLDDVVDGSLDGLTPPSIASDDIAEILTRIKIEYYEKLQIELEIDILDDTPPCFDAILAVLSEIGMSEYACREAIRAPPTLEDCPICGLPTSYENGSLQCTDCYWEKDRYSVLPYRNRKRARAISYLRTVDDPQVDQNHLCYVSIPHPSGLPDNPLILDATATREKVAAFYAKATEDIDTHGDEPLELSATVKQIRDGGYHQGTIKEALNDDDRTLDDRLGVAIETIAERYDKPLFIAKRDLLSRFDLDEEDSLYYWGLRGLNKQECDAVICIGGPHPKVKGLMAKARLLAIDHPSFDAGGVEFGLRDGAPNPPIYRKLNYQDDNGLGRAVPTKHYSGLFGKLFREEREKELEQAVNRIRPVFPDSDKNIYLLTNIPTSLPVDEFIDLDAFAPLSTHLPQEDVVEFLLSPLLEACEQDTDHVTLDEGTISTTTAGLEAIARNAGAGWSKTTAHRRKNDLTELGLLEEGKYIQDQGKQYTADRDAISDALLVLNSMFEKAEEVSRFRERIDNADGSLEWLNWSSDKIRRE